MAKIGAKGIIKAGFGHTTNVPNAVMNSLVMARILLMLALTKTQDPKEIQRIFDEY